MFTKEEMETAVRERVGADPAFAALMTAVGSLLQAGKQLEQRVDTLAFMVDTVETKVSGRAVDTAVIGSKVE